MVLKCSRLFVYVFNRIRVFKYLESSMEYHEASRVNYAHAEDEEGFSSEHEAFSTAQLAKAVAERLKRHPW